MQEKSVFQNIVDRETGLQRSLTHGQMTMIAIGGAIGTGLFMGSGFAIGFAGPGVLLSYFIGAVITMLLMGCLAEMTIAHPTSGSFGAYAEHYISPWAGFLVRYSYWACVVLAVGTEVTAVAIYMKYWFPAVPGWFWITGFSACLILVNAFSVKLFGVVEYWFSLIKIAAIVGFIILGAYVIFGSPETVVNVDTDGTRHVAGFANYFVHDGFFPHGMWGMWSAVIVAIFSYLSVEMIAIAAGEAKEPEKAVTRAFRSTIVRLVLFYLLTLALMLAIVPWTAASHSKSPFVMVMESIGIPGAAGVINFVVLVAALSSMNSQLYITTRMMFSLSRAGDAPAVFGKLNRRGVPLAALLLSTIGIAAATVLSIVYPEGSFTVMMSIAMFGAMFTWMMIFLTHYFFRQRRKALKLAPLSFTMAGFPVATLIGAGLMLAIMISTLFVNEFHSTLLFGIPFLILLSVAYFLRYSKKKVAVQV